MECPGYRQAILSITKPHIDCDNKSIEYIEVAKVPVFIWAFASKENALCEHQDGTFSYEQWQNLCLIDNFFDQYNWNKE